MSAMKHEDNTIEDSPLRMLRVCDRVTDNVLQENLENATGLLIDETRDTFHTATTSETANSLWRGNVRNGRTMTTRRDSRA